MFYFLLTVSFIVIVGGMVFDTAVWYDDIMGDIEKRRAHIRQMEQELAGAVGGLEPDPDSVPGGITLKAS